MDAPQELHVLNFGCGVQSTALYLMGCDPASGLRFDAAIFGDTQAEPRRVYEHLEWCRSIGGPPIIVDTAGSLEEHLLNGQNSTGQRFASIPAFTAESHETRDSASPPDPGMVRRQCTKEYKIDVVARVIRRQLLGLKPRQRVPKSVKVYQYFGISADEAGRARRVKENFARSVKWSTPRFPLIEMGWTRQGCVRWLAKKVPHRVPRSACVFCPYRDDHEWAEMRREEPAEFGRACRLDDALRTPGNVVNRSMDQSLYLHRSCVPLRLVDFDNLPPQTLPQRSIFDCVGMCGN